MAAHIVKPELLAQEIGQRASVNELAAVIQQPGDIRNGRRLRQRPLDLVLRVHAASMRCARSIVQLYLRVKGRARRRFSPEARLRRRTQTTNPEIRGFQYGLKRLALQAPVFRLLDRLPGCSESLRQPRAWLLRCSLRRW